MALEQELRRLAIWRNSTTLHQDSSEYNWKEQFFFVRLPALWSAHELSDFSQKAFRASLDAGSVACFGILATDAGSRWAELSPPDRTTCLDTSSADGPPRSNRSRRLVDGNQRCFQFIDALTRKDSAQYATRPHQTLAPWSFQAVGQNSWIRGFLPCHFFATFQLKLIVMGVGWLTWAPLLVFLCRGEWDQVTMLLPLAARSLRH